jgi:ABC-2 type transport system permease protein
MAATVFRWELLALRRDPAVWLASILVIIAIAFALSNGGRWLAFRESVEAAATARELSARAEARAYAARIDSGAEPAPFFERDPRYTPAYANNLMIHYAVLPATPLAALSAGQSDLLPSVLPLVAGRLPSLAAGSEPENPHRLLIGRFDAGYVVIFLLPLVVIALTYALLAGERERGTLALLLSQPLTAASLFVAKLAVRIALVLAFLLTLVVLFLWSAPATDWSRLALWTCVATAYCAFWFALSAAVAARNGGSATHAIALASCWLALTLLLPASINLAVKTLAPVPSRVELILAMRAATDAANTERSELLGAFYDDHPDLAPAAGSPDDFAMLQFVTSQKIEGDLIPVLARYDEQLARQQALVEKLQFLSPALLAQSALADAAGTGLARHRRFFVQALEHHRELRAFFEPRLLVKQKFSAWDEVPAFRYVEEPATDAAARVAPALAALLLATIGLGLLSWRTLRHRPSVG